MKSQIRKRTESFAWRLGGMMGIAILSFLVEPDTLAALNESGVVVPALITTVIGLAIGEVTKWLNNKRKTTSGV